MILIKPSFNILSIMTFMNSSLRLIEVAGRTCYKSEERITEDSSNKFIEMIKRNEHESVLEHSAMTIRFICDRGVSHELVRHRLASFSQESTRYCNYSGGVTFIIPPWVDIEEGNYPLIIKRSDADGSWMSAMALSRNILFRLIRKGLVSSTSQKCSS